MKIIWNKFVKWLFSWKICKNCHHECHCDDGLHADEYGICVCEVCKCQ